MNDESRQRHADLWRRYHEAELVQAQWRAQRRAQKRAAHREFRYYATIAVAYAALAVGFLAIGLVSHHLTSGVWGGFAAILAAFAAVFALLAIREWRRMP